MNKKIIFLFVLCAVFFAGCTKVPRIVTFSDPLTAEEHTTLGAIYEKGNNIERALEEYSAALKKDPENIVALTGLGNLSLTQEKPKLAATYYSRALKLEPENVVILNNLANAWTMAGNSKKALQYADEAVKACDGNDPRILDTRADAYLLLGDKKSAKKDLEKAVEICGGGVWDEENMVEPCADICHKNEGLVIDE